jgi:hypothetical protein
MEISVTIPPLVWRLFHTYFLFDRCYEKFYGRTHGSNKSSRNICVDACCLGIWCIYGVNKKFLQVNRFFFSTSAPIRPLLGGTLARPSDHFPTVFTGGFWKEYPYYLPCLASGIFVLLALVIVAAFFKEVCFVYMCSGFVSFANTSSLSFYCSH